MESSGADICQNDIFERILLQFLYRVNTYTVITHQQVAQTDDRYTGMFVFMFQLAASHSVYDRFFAGTYDMCCAVQTRIE